jgi:hypothetical protein
MYNDIRSFVNLSGNNIIGLDYLVFCDSPIQYRTEHFENRTFRKPDVLRPDVLKPGRFESERFENPGWYVGVPKL